MLSIARQRPTVARPGAGRGALDRCPRWRRAVGRGERERALVAAEAINMLALPWDPLLRAAVLGHLGQQEKARAALGELLALDPAFAHHARRYISGYVFQADLLAVIVDGLKRAGLKI